MRRRLIFAAVFCLSLATGASAQQQAGGATLFQGYTGAAFSYGFYGRNQAAGTGTNLLSGFGNYGVVGAAVPTGGSAGYEIGTLGVAAFGGVNFGVIGRSVEFKAGASNVGGAFWGINTSAGSIQGPSVGVYASLDTLPSTPAALAAQLETAALIADNRATAAPVLLARNNGLTVLSVPGDGQLQLHQAAGSTKPACDAAHRGAFWYEAGAAGVADTLEACRKDAADAYAWVGI